MSTQLCILGALLVLLCCGGALAAETFPGDAHLRDYFLTKRGVGLYFNDNFAKLSISSVRTPAAACCSCFSCTPARSPPHLSWRTARSDQLRDSRERAGAYVGL